jgi:hypothetical protein
MRMSSVCGPAAWRFDDLTENDKNELFKNSIQAYIEYLEELKEKEKKIAIKSSFMYGGLVKILREKESPFDKFSHLTQED